MANTTFTGAVRSENGFKVVSKNATTGAYTDTAVIASTGIVTNKYVKHVGFATGVTVNSTAGDSPTIGEFSQPALPDSTLLSGTGPTIIGSALHRSGNRGRHRAAIAQRRSRMGSATREPAGCFWTSRNRYLQITTLTGCPWVNNTLVREC